MSHDRVPYQPITERPRLTWPGGARVAVWVVPNVEHYEYLPNPIRERNPWPRMPHPDVLGYGIRDYGNRVGLWRMAKVTDALGTPCTLSLNMAFTPGFSGYRTASAISTGARRVGAVRGRLAHRLAHDARRHRRARAPGRLSARAISGAPAPCRAPSPRRPGSAR